ncbi:MAG TPA: 4a-hydroxytetrahydrobiopterin dehydratase [Candidatus Paceibacterota bacterium]|jgi:4a-hydroxytetrahydrobiopterin dehydratase
MNEFKDRHCVPCERDDFPPLTPEQAQDFMEHIPGWELAEDARSISRGYTFKDFKEALAFTNKVGDLAEEEGHHPDIELSWGRVTLSLTTHSIGGLSENDVILAAKVNGLQN